MGVWIETFHSCHNRLWFLVTPCVGVWIETTYGTGWVRWWTTSHPAWVCGLKPFSISHHNTRLCHTLRGCVDWNMDAFGKRQKSGGHTLRGCVDWNTPIRFILLALRVTPCVGVWIETRSRRCGPGTSGHTLRGCVDWNIFQYQHCQQPHQVTPCVGVWIETSPPTGTVRESRVTPCVGVWIETWIRAGSPWNRTSHPAWVCGLKLMGDTTGRTNRLSHPAWVCGLKPKIGTKWDRILMSHPAWVCGLKRKTSRSPILLYGSHPAWVCGLKLKTYCTIFYYLSHTLRGCVDWNSYEKEIR